MSESFSLKGWNFWEWVKGNKSTVLELFKVGVPYLVSTLITAQPEYQFVITAVGKLVLDVAHYYLVEQK